VSPVSSQYFLSFTKLKAQSSSVVDSTEGAAARFGATDGLVGILFVISSSSLFFLFCEEERVAAAYLRVPQWAFVVKWSCVVLPPSETADSQFL
jgi:hypothetical protein